MLAAARAAFAEHGADASVDLIAARAGLTVGTVYRHFASKHDLVKTVLDGVVNDAVNDMVNNLARNVASNVATGAAEDMLGPAVTDATNQIQQDHAHMRVSNIVGSAGQVQSEPEPWAALTSALERYC